MFGDDPMSVNVDNALVLDLRLALRLFGIGFENGKR